MIEENVKKILEELPPGVKLMAAAKSRTPKEILRAVEAGVTIIGENYVQEALAAFEVVGPLVKWHFNKRCSQHNRIMPVLVEMNSGREPQKFGVLPEEAETLIKEMLPLQNVKIEGLMTMGPMFGDPEDARPYFIETRKIFDQLRSLALPGVEMRYLSMGMTNSYKVALEEGANIVRIGTKIFGPRG